MLSWSLRSQSPGSRPRRGRGGELPEDLRAVELCADLVIADVRLRAAIALAPSRNVITRILSARACGRSSARQASGSTSSGETTCPRCRTSAQSPLGRSRSSLKIRANRC